MAISPETQSVGLQEKLANVEAERDLLKARQKAIHRALMAKEFDEDRPLPPKPRPPDPRQLDALEREVKALKFQLNMSARVLWRIARVAGGTYTFDASGTGDCPVEPAVSVRGEVGGTMTIAAMSAGEAAPGLRATWSMPPQTKHLGVS